MVFFILSLHGVLVLVLLCCLFSKISCWVLDFWSRVLISGGDWVLSASTWYLLLLHFFIMVTVNCFTCKLLLVGLFVVSEVFWDVGI